MNRRLRILVAAATALAMIALGAGVALLLDDEPSASDVAVAGPTDIGFAQDMSVHHSQAVQMADVVASNHDPTIVALGDRITRAQLTEIGQMQGFLVLWDQPPMATRQPMAWMASHSGHRGHGAEGAESAAEPVAMPGMATQGQLHRLRSLKGRAQAVLFLQLMLRHHQGGVDMADYAAERAVVPAVRALANRMSFDQKQEIQLMKQLLLARGVDPRLPPG